VVPARSPSPAVGFLFALLVLAISVVSFPLLLDDPAVSPIPRPPPVTSARLPSRRKEGGLARSTVIGSR
jgi:hypothetical protein